MPSTVLITGCSSGIGNATAKFFASKGWNVAATMRSPECEAGNELSQLANVLVSKVDVVDRSSIDSAVAATIAKFGGLDVVVNNAGYGHIGPAEFSTKDQVMAQLETNVYGPVAVTQAALSHFRFKKSGLIVNVGSVAGRTVVVPFQSVYNASKFALEGFTEAINLELVPLGIRVKIVEPGPTLTDCASRVVLAKSRKDMSYDEAFKRSLGEIRNVFGLPPSSSEHIACAIYEAATDGTEKVRYLAGKDAIKLFEERQSLTDEEWVTAMISKYQLDQ